MQRNTDYKQCPKCGQAAALTDPRCVRCGHQYSTHFPPPNQAQAFTGGAPMPPPNQTQAFMPGGQPPPNQTRAFFPPGGQPPPNQTQAFLPPGAQPYGYPTQDQFASFLLSIPPGVCFLIGFFTNMIAIGLIICYFAYAPARNPQRGWATAWGMIASFLCGFGWLAMGMWLRLGRIH